MAEEQVIYRCYWITGGKQYPEDYVEIEGEESGAIGICTFPGLERTVKSDDGDSIVRIVKASALSESAFTVQ
jgi:hypothetical protein